MSHMNVQRRGVLTPFDDSIDDTSQLPNNWILAEKQYQKGSLFPFASRGRPPVFIDICPPGKVFMFIWVPWMRSTYRKPQLPQNTQRHSPLVCLLLHNAYSPLSPGVYKQSAFPYGPVDLMTSLRIRSRSIQRTLLGVCRTPVHSCQSEAFGRGPPLPNIVGGC